MSLFGPNTKQILTAGDVAAIPIVSEVATIYTKSFRLVNCGSFSLWLKAAGTTVRLDIFLEQSFQLPTTEGSSDANWVVPEGASPLFNDLVDTNAHIITSIAPAVLPFGRLKIVPNVGNGANTTLTAHLGVQSER